MPPFDDNDVTPPPIDLSRPRITVEPTMQGLANGILNTYEEVVANRKTLVAMRAEMVTRDDCAANRAACQAAAIAAARRRGPSIETRRRWWAWLDTTAGAITRIVVLVGMVASGAWWLVNELAEMKASTRDMRTQIVKELRGNETARRVDRARDERR
jgi:hypothetical protein